MTWFDRSRRAATVVLVAVCLSMVPSLADAAFSSGQAGGVSVGTASLVAPTAVTGTYKCVNGGLTREGFDVTVNGFTDAGPTGATYLYSMLRKGAVVKTASSTARTMTLSSGNLTADGTSTQWTVTIQATLGSWSGPAYTRTITCAPLMGGSGTL